MTVTTQDVVGVFDSGFNQVFVAARSIKALVKEDAKVMKQPLEDGATVSDHIIFNPVLIDLSVIVQAPNVADTYQEIKNLYRAATILNVQTNTDTYTSMCISAMPHDETPEMYDAVAIAIKLEEADFITAQFGTLAIANVKKKSDASTVKAGQKTAAPVDNGTMLQQGYNAIFGSKQ